MVGLCWAPRKNSSYLLLRSHYKACNDGKLDQYLAVTFALSRSELDRLRF